MSNPIRDALAELVARGDAAADTWDNPASRAGYVAAWEAARAALAASERDAQPVAWYQERGHEVITSHPECWGRADEPWIPLYTRPQPAQEPLTDEQLRECFCATNTAEPLSEGWPGLERFARAVERAHGIGEPKP